MSYYNHQTPPLLRNSYSHQDAPFILKNFQPPQSNPQNKQTHLNPNDVK